jgi:hypothetical protein
MYDQEYVAAIPISFFYALRGRNKPESIHEAQQH